MSARIAAARAAVLQAAAGLVQSGSLEPSSATFVLNCEGTEIMATATVSVQITDVAPELVDDVASTAPNLPVDIAVLANDTDPLGRELRVTAVQSPTALGGTAVILPNGTHVRYTPPANIANRQDTFTYEAAPV